MCTGWRQPASNLNLLALAWRGAVLPGIFRQLANVDKKCHVELNDRDSRLIFKLHCKFGAPFHLAAK